MAATRTRLRSSSRPTRPIMVTLAAGLVAAYAAVFIVWDIIAPFERPYAEGPVSVILGFRVFGLSAQLMHALQLMVAGSLAYHLWTMQRFGWHLVVFSVGYMLVSYVIWAQVYNESEYVVGFGLFYVVILLILLALTFPHRRKFV